jgi:hypothetical protein
MSVSNVNYRENYFQHPSLTKIHGDPTYTSLSKLEKECKANGKSVTSTLGGGQQGHLGLVSSVPAYERIAPGTPFERPILPVLPAGLEGATQFQIAEAHQVFNRDLAAFNACNLVERTILQQISTAIDEDCMANLIDENTGLLEGTVPQVFRELFDTYGRITPQALTASKTDLEAMSYNHSKPIVNIFTAINEYASMAEAADAAETPAQLVNIGLIIISRATIFDGDVRKWHDRPEADKTWPDFKNHFKEAQRAIKRSQPTMTTDALGYHEQAASASALASQVLQLTAQRDAETAALALLTAQQDEPAQTNSTQDQMMEQMQLLMSTVLQQSTNNNANHQQRRTGGGRGRSNGQANGRGGRGRGPGAGRLPPAYCWTHGNCSHNGTDCNNKAEGHIDTATYTNTQGGSQHRFHWL